MAERILIVDDEETLCEALRFNLDAAGYETAVAHSAEEALATDLSGFSLILLDIMMGEISGVQLARIIRNNAATARIPIIFCTAKDGEEDMIEGLDLGADDYITKPYSLRNVLARIRSVLRRCPGGGGNTSDTDGLISFEGLSVDTPGKRVEADGNEVRLTRKEFEILSLLLRNRGRIFSREEILTRIWPDEVIVVDRVIDVNITRIRQKIGRYGKNIVTRSGFGYGFIG